jgi:hypothetical protein
MHSESREGYCREEMKEGGIGRWGDGEIRGWGDEGTEKLRDRMSVERRA